MSGDVDVAVVGGGVIGVMTAHEILSRSPGTRLAVLERDAVGQGASRRSAGLHIPRGATPRVREMTEYSEDFYRRLRAADPSVPVTPLPMHVVAPASAAGPVRERYVRTAAPAPVRELDAPRVRLGPGEAAWRVAGCQYADVPALVQWLARKVRHRADVREAVAVTGVEPAPGAVRLRLGTGEVLTAGQVVLAPGPWTGGRPGGTSWRRWRSG
ncbi:hypothetical protein GCM10020295_16210 [Streptomyces cinereospinus]